MKSAYLTLSFLAYFITFDCLSADHTFTVARHKTVTLDDAAAKSILEAAELLLRSKDDSNDIEANVDLRLNSPVATFEIPSAVVNSEQDFRNLANVGANIVVVAEINWCGGLGANIVGCAPVGGNYMVVVRREGPTEAILWAHEFGHNCGLRHRDHDLAVMAPVLGGNHKQLTVEERTKYEAKVLGAVNAQTEALLAVQSQEDAPKAESDTQNQDVKEFLNKDYFHGVPIDQARKFGPEDSKRVATILQDPSQKRYWANAAIVLGAIGEKEGVQVLEDFIKRGEGTLSPEDYQAKKAALMSIGYAANRGKTNEALRFLSEGVKPEFWTDTAKIKWVAPHLPTKEKTAIQLSTISVLGLAVSGKEEAGKVLEEVKAGKAGNIQPALGPLADEALKEHKKVQTLGLDQYSQKAHDNHKDMEMRK